MAQEDFVVPDANVLIYPSSDDRMVLCEVVPGVQVVKHESDLLVLRGRDENDDEVSLWVQYHLPSNGQLVHRSAHVHLKKPMVFAEGSAAALG